ncbi:hypothetical protein PQQ63_16545 [Paraburkholderia metrosideri]|uniref:Uncharacterized protein n=1 Tax=Paraburkholderia metrosideri TaxID=580937 RepID=A0ABW9DTH4_9BURK
MEQQAGRFVSRPYVGRGTFRAFSRPQRKGKATRNLHAAFARRHWFNAHYVHDRASALRRFGARHPKRQWNGAQIDRPDGRQTRQTWQQAVIRAGRAVPAVFRLTA